MPYYPTPHEENSERLGELIGTLQFMQGRSALLDQVTRELNQLVYKIECKEDLSREELEKAVTKVYKLAKGY